jgi:hypothetical protein
VVGSCEQGDEITGYIKSRKFLYLLSDYKLLKWDSCFLVVTVALWLIHFILYHIFLCFSLM